VEVAADTSLEFTGRWERRPQRTFREGETVRWMRYMLAQRVCRRGPLPRHVKEICGRGRELASGEESTPERLESLEGDRASAERGCFERGTLNANRKAN
jgi:hypothetical protein